MDEMDFSSITNIIDELKSCIKKKFSPTLVLDKKRKIKAMAPFALHIFNEKISPLKHIQILMLY